MKCGIRFKALASTVVGIGIFVLVLVLEDKCETYDPWGYAQASLPWLQVEDSGEASPLGGKVRDQIIVVPALEDEDVSWVTDELQEWQHAIYTVNPSSDETRASTLTTPVNKGHEAMAYLTYIIDNYEDGSIPGVVAFLHAHRNGFFTAWHVDTPLHDNVYAMRHLQVDYIRQVGFVNLRCNLNPGCTKQRKTNPHATAEIFNEVMGQTSTPIFSQNSSEPGAVAGYSTLEDKQGAGAIQPRVWSPCCAQFAVSREQIYQRPLEDYLKIRQWVIDTEKDDAKSGRVMEYFWHIIFGQKALYCPDPDICHCNVYGRC